MTTPDLSADPIRVLHVLDTRQFAGTESHVLTLMEAQREQGHMPLLACHHDSPFQEVAKRRGLHSRDLSSKGIGGLIRSLRRLIIEIRPDLTHAHNGRTMLAAAAVGPLLGIPVIGTQHFIEPQFTTYRGPKRLFANIAHAWVNKRMSHVIAMSEAGRQAMIRREHIAPSKITTVHNGIFTPLIPEPASLVRLLSDAGMTGGGPVIVAVARLSREKGLDHLVRAVPAVIAACPEARFLIAGEGPARHELADLIAANNVTHAVRLLGFRDDPLSLIAAADLLVLPSLAEPFGLVLLEAMALGKPVIATRAGGPLEIVVDGVTGLLVSPGDSDALARAILELMSKPNLRREMGRKGLERFGERFTARRMAQETAAVYRSVLERGRTQQVH